MTILLLISGGEMNSVWGKVTYRILTLPITTHQLENSQTEKLASKMGALSEKHPDVRLEALVCTSSSTTLGLPDEFKSPLAKNYKYWSTATQISGDTWQTLYGYCSTTFMIYQKVDGELTGSTVTDGSTVYVTYEYIGSNDTLDLNGKKEYNVLMQSSDSKQRFLALNAGWGNRSTSYYASDIVNEGVVNLATDTIVKLTHVKDGAYHGKWNGRGPYFFLGFKFDNESTKGVSSISDYPRGIVANPDPYNIRVCTSYMGTETYIEGDKAIGSNVVKEYRGGSIFWLRGSEQTSWLASDDDIQWTNTSSGTATYAYVPGYYRGTGQNGTPHSEMNPIINSFALLNHSSGAEKAFALVATKMNNNKATSAQPNSKSEYLFWCGNDTKNQPKWYTVSNTNSDKLYFYEIRNYTFHVKTPSGQDVKAIRRWSDYAIGYAIEDSHVPDSLRRKYCNYVSFYSDAALTVPITTYQEAYDAASTAAGGGVPTTIPIYVKYEVSDNIPFTLSTDYSDATWYELTDAAHAETDGMKLLYDGATFKNNGARGSYVRNGMFAFVGDPYELKVIHRGTSTSGNSYVGVASEENLGVNTSDATGYVWEIPYDNTDGSFLLRQFNTLPSTPMYWHWDTASRGETVTKSSASSTRVKVLELPNLTYKYIIVDNLNNESVMASATQAIFSKLSLSSIPEIIRSPFIDDETLTFYSSYSGGSGSVITEAPGEANSSIYVRYTTVKLGNKPIKMDGVQEFFVKVNGEYIYYDGNSIKSAASLPDTSGEPEEQIAALQKPYLWIISGLDPYAMQIKNKQAGKFISTTTTWSDNATLSFDGSSGSKFVAMSSTESGAYEVMAAAGSGEDASTTYYNIGRTADNTVVMTGNATAAHGSNIIKVNLEGSVTYTYKLIDKAHHVLLTAESKSPDLVLPASLQSPLVGTYHYWKASSISKTDTDSDGVYEYTTSGTEIKAATDADHSGDEANVIYVTYDINDLVTFNSVGAQYLIKFANGGTYYLEDGVDRLTSDPKQAAYIYANGDNNLNIYDQEQYEEQMGGGSSARPRWAWFLESSNSDPYHVKIYSKQTTNYLDDNHHLYLRTFKQAFVQDGTGTAAHVVTGSTLPAITGNAATEYMILGTAAHNYRLVTTYPLDGTPSENIADRETVKSVEQYWKTYNMIKQHLLGKTSADDVNSTDPSTFVVPNDLRDDLLAALRSKGITTATTWDACDWHSYETFAYAVRWNGYNADGAHNKKTYETLEHWFQTFDLGDGTFDIIEADIPPVLVLVDNHGWEIMRKPLPTSSIDEAEKLAAIRAYNSPMVKAYTYYTSAKKASSFHKYYSLSKAVAKDGTTYTTTDLGNLPPTSATYMLDSYGAQQDLFVTYTVKDEYADSYRYSLKADTTKTDGKITNISITETIQASKFIIRQGNNYASDGGGTLTSNTIPDGGISKMIVNSNGAIDDKYLWYVKPNNSIDEELGITWALDYGNASEPYNEAETRASYAGKSGFDPYNIQIKNASTNRFFTASTTGATLTGGAIVGVGSTSVSLEDSTSTDRKFTFEYHDHSEPNVTNQTFMAVQDENGNMQLMPRFDHTVRVNDFTTLASPLTAAADDQVGEQTTFIVRPLVYEYIIVDNQGRESLRYKTGGEYYPDIPNHFMSPQAGDYKYYFGHAAYSVSTSTQAKYDEAGSTYQKTAASVTAMETEAKTLTTAGTYYYKVGAESNFSYMKVVVTAGSSNFMTDVRDRNDISAKEITGSFAASHLTDNNNTVYVRYSYSPANDNYHYYTLEGAWYTLQLNGQWMVYNEGIKAASDKPTNESDPTLNDSRQWQWKFRQTPYTDIDPYAVEIYNRSYNYNNRTSPLPGDDVRFALLSHPSNGYALAKCNTESTTEYLFLNGASMTASDAASIKKEAGFDTYSGSFDGTESQLLLTDDIVPSYTYRVYTGVYAGGNAGTDVSYGGKEAISATQTNDDALGNSYVPLLPESAQTPLLSTDDYLYFEQQADTVSADKAIETLYGLYDDVVYVRYNAYNRSDENYLVPNVRNAPSETRVAKASTSNDSPIDINGELVYNIIWYEDYMMKVEESSVTSAPSQALNGDGAFVWMFEGNDPYAIKIKHKQTRKYAVGTATLADAATSTFMLLKRDGFDYGILQVTGDLTTGKKLTDSGNALTANAATTPNKFIIFALSTNQVIYDLIIQNIGQSETIPYREGTTACTIPWTESQTIEIAGSSKRNLTANPIDNVDAGPISLGADFSTPDTSPIYRPNCMFNYYIEGIYDDTACSTANSTLNTRYKGLKLAAMPSDADLIGKTVKVNVTYAFDTRLGTNAGGHFVNTYEQNLWYTFDVKGSGSKVYLAQYTNAWGLKTLEGRTSRYTNDYLWTPVGDPYGFVMYNRYMIKNSGDTSAVMSTENLSAGTRVKLLTNYEDNSIYELLKSSTDGYFYVHPVANTANDLFLYMNTSDNNFTTLSTTRSQWTFGLSLEQLEPYFERTGYVGGLTKTAYEAESNQALVAAIKAGTLTYAQLVATQKLVYDDANIQPYAVGYYRLHSQPDLPNVATPRYASGYLHEIEKTAGTDGKGIPMHFYSREGVTTVFESSTDLNAPNSGYTSTAATRGELPILATENDPSTIFYFPSKEVVTSSTNSLKNVPKSKIRTLDNLMVKDDADHHSAIMDDTGTDLYIMDIGGATLLIHDGAAPQDRKYLCFEQTAADSIYQLQFKHDTPTDEAKWCMVPADTLGLVIPVNNGGDGHYYTTFYAPFDVMLSKTTDTAYVCTEWSDHVLFPIPVGTAVNTEAKLCPVDYRGSNQFVPAGTPVIIRSSKSDDIRLSLPTSEPHPLVHGCVFSGQYLEQKLSTEYGDNHKILTFGLPITGITMSAESGDTNGEVPNVNTMKKASTGVGFYINATPNKEKDMSKSLWTRNNRYVLHNKIYYEYTSSGSGAPARGTDGEMTFVPVIFDREEEEEGGITSQPGSFVNDHVFDLSGRCVAAGESVLDGSWRRQVAPGIYMLGGRKVMIGTR